MFLYYFYFFVKRDNLEHGLRQQLGPLLHEESLWPHTNINILHSDWNHIFAMGFVVALYNAIIINDWSIKYMQLSWFLKVWVQLVNFLFLFITLINRASVDICGRWRRTCSLMVGIGHDLDKPYFQGISLFLT